MSDSIAEKLDELLEKDRTLTTRTGMTFLTQLVRDAFKYIEKEKDQNNKEEERIRSVEERLDNFQKTFNAFLDARQVEQSKAEEERKWWRRAMLTPVLGILITEIIRLILFH